ncbi:1659_t:CDS:2, partial [Acaulospora colombiana]
VVFAKPAWIYNVGSISRRSRLILDWTTPDPQPRRSAMSLHEDLTSQPSQTRLPNEILITIIEFIHAKKELYTLCLSSRLVREVATPILYLHHFAGNALANAHSLNLSMFLQHPQFEHIDEELGAVLTNLPNLKVLDINCNLCPVQGFTRHQYFVHLKTQGIEMTQMLGSRCMDSVTSLDVLHERSYLDDSTRFEAFLRDPRVLPKLEEFHHNGSKFDDLLLREIEMSKILGSPCMDSVISLAWHIVGFREDACAHFESSLKNTTILPKLEELDHQDRRYDDLLLRYRRIRRLKGTSLHFPMLNGRDLQREYSALTHLSISYLDVKHFSANVLEQYPNALPNLRHIGTPQYWGKSQSPS